MNIIMKMTRMMAAAGAALLLAACTEDTFGGLPDRVAEGIPVTVRLAFRATEAAVETRTAQDKASENRVDNVYILIFNEAGEVHDRFFCKPGSGLSYDSGDNLLNSGKLVFSTKSLNNATIVGIANLADGSTSTAYTVTAEELDAVRTLDELKTKVMAMRDNSIYRSAFFMMTGYAKMKEPQAGKDPTLVTIPAVESAGTETLGCTLQLERTDAKVKFVVKAMSPDASKTEFSFQPTGWRVKQVPRQSFILPRDKVDAGGPGDADGEGCVYFASSVYEFEDFIREGSLYQGGSFVFYMPENRKMYKQKITDTDAKKAYALRDKREKTTTDAGGSVTPGDFLYAHANSTYVEITGLLSYFEEVDGLKQLTYANVRLTVHLGYADGDVNDYETLRNHSYTYTVTIKGVDSIDVDVMPGEEEQRPGYDGDVVMSFHDVFYFDSHYDRRLIKLNKSGFTEKQDGSTAGILRWGVSTPFSRGVHEVVADAGKIPANLRDYRWIKFAVNREYGVDDDKLVKYPGDQNYNDPFPVDEEHNNQPSPYYSTPDRNYPHARLRDVNQLMNFLREEAAKDQSAVFDENGNVSITAFVDENVYVYDPTEEKPALDLKLWKRMAETDDRQLYIIVDDARFSPDNQSSIVKAQYYFRQRSIRTVYNVNKAELDTGWGLESVMEAKRLWTGSISQGTVTGKDNGRENTLRILLGNDYATRPRKLEWTTVLNTSTHYGLNAGYNRAIYACLIRNRDLNGDNIVDADEIRWYLASINQLVDIYLGEYALDEPSRLYPRNDVDRTEDGKVKKYWHYTSSSYMEITDPWVLWSEEGASLGLKSGSEKNYNGEYYSYRCLRNLGLPLDEPDKEPADLVDYQQMGGTMRYRIDVSNMNEKSRRTNLETRLAPHNERDADNRPYTYFEVHPNRFGTRNQWTFYQTNDPSPVGYRIPNQRELLIMSTRLPRSAWDADYDGYYVCQTGFSLNGTYPYASGDRSGFMWWVHSNFILVNESRHAGVVRPVKDITSMDAP